jgi:hypothetical protein
VIDARGAGRRALDAARRAAPAWVAAGIVLVVGAVLAATGAFTTAVHEPERLTVGDEVRLSTYTVSVRDVELADAVEDQHVEADPGETLLLVTVRLENLTDRAVGVGTTADRITSRLVNATQALLALSGVDDLESARIWHDETSVRSPLLQPDVPADITLAWRIPTAALDAEDIALDVYDAKVRTGKIILSSDVVTWRRGEHVARIDLGLGG